MRIGVLVLILLVALAVYLAYEVVRMALLVRESSELVRVSSPFSRENPEATIRILVLGDSTAVGTGAADTHNSTAGRLSTRYPNATVVNHAENGLRLAGLREQMNAFDADEHFDIILIQIGANDIIRFTSMESIRTDSAAVFTRAKEMGDTVVVLHSGNVGDAPFFPWFMRPTFKARSVAVRDIYREHEATVGVRYVDLLDSPTAHLFREEPLRYHAKDSLHLTDEGYGLWFDQIEKLLP